MDTAEFETTNTDGTITCHRIVHGEIFSHRIGEPENVQRRSADTISGYVGTPDRYQAWWDQEQARSMRLANTHRHLAEEAEKLERAAKRGARQFEKREDRELSAELPTEQLETEAAMQELRKGLAEGAGRHEKVARMRRLAAVQVVHKERVPPVRARQRNRRWRMLLGE
jgi:hypothetical protein